MAAVEPLRPGDQAQPEATRRSFVTPEGIDLGLRIGEAGERALAFLIDWAIIIAGRVRRR